jgi:hypothetical protein
MALEDIPQLSPMARCCLPQWPRYCPTARRMQELRARLFVLESSQAQKTRIRFFGNLSQKRQNTTCRLASFKRR